MARRRLVLEQLETRLCMAAPTLQATVNLPRQSGAWTATPYRASPLMVDIFGTGKDDLITVTAGAQLVAYGVNSSGTKVPVVTYQTPGGTVADIKSTPLIVTDPRTGRKDLFAAMGRDESHNGAIEDGRVFGWDLQTGQLLAGWTSGVSTGKNVDGLSGVYGAITQGDLDGDGVPELVVTSFSHNVVAIHLDGSVLWSWTNDDTILSGAVIGDIDRTGVPSVVVGGDSSDSAFFKAGGWVNVLTNTGTLKWRKYIPGEVTWSSPTLADLNNNGNLDIIIGTGLNFDFAGVPGARALGNNIYAFDPFGNILPGWPYHTTTNDSQAHQVLNSIAVADILGNGRLDVVAIDRAGYLHVVAPNGQALPGFVGGKAITPEFAISGLPDNYASPIIADVLGTGRPQIIAANGPFLRAFDANGNVTVIATATKADGNPEGIDSAAVVGNMNGGTNGTLAFVTYDPQNANRPDRAYFYRLEATSAVAPWPSIRRTNTNDAVARSPVYDQNYVATAFLSATGSVPGADVLQPYLTALNSDQINLRTTASLIFSSPQARQAEVQRQYQTILGRSAEPNGLAFWTNFLATRTNRELSLTLVGSAEFASLGGNTLAGQVSRLYQSLLNRTASQGEISAWVATGLSPVAIAAQFINSPEAINKTFNASMTASFGAKATAQATADNRASFAYDYRRGGREEDLKTILLSNNGNYAAANFPARYTRELYRDILKREASPNEVAAWVQAYDANSTSLGAQVALLLNSDEARRLVVNQEFVALLGRSADSGALAGLSGYANREALILTIIGSDEYFNHNGGTVSTYISAVYRDLAAFSPTPRSAIDSWTQQFNMGTPRIVLAQAIMANPSLYSYQTAVAQITQYLPDQTQGVLRSGALPITAPGQPINPSPALINYLVGLYKSGASDEQVIGTLLTSIPYVTQASYNRGILRRPGIRA